MATYGLSTGSKYLITPAESINRDWDWYTIRTLVDITPTGTKTDASQQAFEALIEYFETRAQPAVIGDVVTTSESGPISDLPAASGAGPYTVYNLRLGVEHKDVWQDLDDFLTGMDGRNGFIYDVANPANNNISLAKDTKLK